MTIPDFEAFKALYASGSFGEITLGRAFCNHYDIEDAELAAEQNPRLAEKIILNKYLEW